MRESITVSTHSREELVDITKQVQQVVDRSGIRDGLVSVYVQGATAGIMIQENWDDSVQTDVVELLRQLIPRGVWRHDAQDGNGDSRPFGTGVLATTTDETGGSHRDRSSGLNSVSFCPIAPLRRVRNGLPAMR